VEKSALKKTNQSAGRRLTVMTIDQVISGASNVLMAVLAAHILGVASFGLFGIVFLVYTLAVGVSRSLVSEPLLVHPLEAEERPGEVIGSGLLISLALAVIVLLAGFIVVLWDASLGYALVVLAGCMPLLVLQDVGRYQAFAIQKPGLAIVLDATWLVLVFGGVAAIAATHARTLVWFIVVWAGSGAAAGLLLFLQYRAREVRITLAWLRFTWGFSWRYLVSYSSIQGAALVGSAAVGAIAGARALGAVQGTLLLQRPFTTFVSAAGAAGIGDIRRSGTAHEIRRHITKLATLSSGAAVLNAIVLLILPSRLGVIVLGETWHAVKPLLLPTALALACLGLMTAPRAGLLGMRRPTPAVVIDVVSTVAGLAATISGAVVDGARGVLWGAVIVRAASLVPWWFSCLKQAASAEPTAMPAADGAEPTAIPGPASAEPALPIGR
jgi:O-antigen/teichoic acid export membrane protein